MHDHSLHSYLNRQSTSQLRGLLQTYLSTGEYGRYIDSLEVVAEILSTRIHEDPSNIQEELQLARQKLSEAKDKEDPAN